MCQWYERGGTSCCGQERIRRKQERGKLVGVMSGTSDDDFWASIQAGNTTSKTQSPPAPQPHLELEVAETTGGTLSPALSQRDLAQRDLVDPEPKGGDAPPSTGKLSWQTTEEQTDGEPRPRRRRKAPPPVLLYASIIAALVWVLGAGLFLSENARSLGADGSTLFGLVILLLGPAAFAILAGVMGDSVSRSNREARALVAAARRMLEPEKMGENAVKSTAHAVKGELDRLENAISGMADRLKHIESSIDTRTTALSSAGDQARGGADALAKTMEVERKRLDQLLSALAELTTSAQNSTRTAAEGLDMRAAVLADVADSLVRKSSEASEVAAAAAGRLEAAAQRAVDAIGQLDQAAHRGEAALARAHDLMVLARLRADEAVGNVGGAVDALRTAAEGANDTVRRTSEEVQTYTQAARDMSLTTVEDIRNAAEMNTRAIAEAMRAEAEAARIAGEETLAALRATADAVRFAAEEAREQANQQLNDNQRRLDSVRQTAFEAGKDADLFAQSRLSDARILIEQSAGLLDETGGRIQERFQKLAAACADQARSVEDVLDTLDRRLDTLPKDAEARAKGIEAALSETLARLTDAGRKASEETAALDAAFQTRLRESYAALGEVVQRLGGLSGVIAPTFVAPSPSPLAPAPLAPAPLAPAPAPLPQTSAHLETPAPSAAPVPEPAPAPAPAPAPTQADASIRVTVDAPGAHDAAEPPAPKVSEPPPPAPTLSQPAKARLQISSPVPVDEDPFSGLSLDANGVPLRQSGGDWSWKEVLSTLDSKAKTSDANKIKAIFSEMSISQRIDENVLERLRTLATRGRDKARQATREAAPETVRAMRRRMVSDPDLRAALVRFVESRREAVARSRVGGDEARLYLVVDAALDA
jgi:hypothetical protein